MKRLISVALVSIFFFTTAVAQINTERMMAIGQNALYFDDYVLSIQYFNQVIKTKPYLAEPYLYRASAKLYLDDNAGSEEDCTKALERNNFMVRAFLCRSYARMRLGKYKEAVADCDKGLEFDVENQTLMLNKGLSQTYEKNFTEGLISFNKLLDHFPTFVNGYMSRGQLYIEKGDTLSAVDDFSRAIAIDRFYAPARAGRGWVYLSMSKYANALPDLNEAIRLEPENPSYYINRGLTRYNLNDLRGTLDDFDRSIRIDPNSKLAYFNRGIIRSQVGDVNRAIEDFDKVIFLEPDNYMAIYNRGLMKQDIGEYKGAVADFSTIIGVYPNFTPAYYQRSDARKKMGDAKGADRDYFAAWNIEEKMKQDRANKKNVASKSAASDTTDTKKKDMSKYNKVIVADTDNGGVNKYQNPMRGRVQDKNIEVQMENLFFITFYEKSRPGPERRIMDYGKYQTELSNAGANSMQKMLISNQELALTTEQADLHFHSIDDYSSRIGQTPDIAALFFARAVDFALVQDLSSAIDDLTRALQLNDKMVLAYFERANLRFKKINVEYASNESAENAKQKVSGDLKNPKTGSFSLGEKAFGTDYDLVMRDYEKVLSLDPNFIYAYYNRANIRSIQRDYRNAIIDYTKALEINPEFADAWFNRGLAQINLGDREHGVSDLRMAGQLGLYQSYNIIKRFE
ncbi:MAG TPA: tetratricopeptide repeat protein [Bacteroidales bacterium]